MRRSACKKDYKGGESRVAPFVQKIGIWSVSLYLVSGSPIWTKKKNNGECAEDLWYLS